MTSKRKKAVSEGPRQRAEFQKTLAVFEKTLQERFVVPGSVSTGYEKELAYEENEDAAVFGPEYSLVLVSRFSDPEKRQRLLSASFRDQVGAADHFPKLIEALVKAQDAMNAQAHQACLLTSAQIRKLQEVEK